MKQIFTRRPVNVIWWSRPAALTYSTSTLRDHQGMRWLCVCVWAGVCVSQVAESSQPWCHYSDDWEGQVMRRKMQLALYGIVAQKTPQF